MELERTKSVAGHALIVAMLVWLLAASATLAEPAKPKVAVFPLGGSAPAEQREKVGFSIRAKLDRAGHYEPIDGPTMLEIAAQTPIDLQTPLKTLQDLAKDESPEVFVWGQLDGAGEAMQLRLKTFDINQPDPLPHEFAKTIAQPTDVRFAVEDVLQTLTDVNRFSHPIEEAVQDDPAAREKFAHNPNLVHNGDFSGDDGWQALLRDQIYTPPVAVTSPPVEDHVAICPVTDDNGQRNRVLAMNLSKEVAENNGLACLSAPIPIEPNTRYRLSFRYRSDGPTLHVFVKGYTTGQGLDGKPAERECYRRQVPPSDATDGKWVTVVCDLNPQNVAVRVEHLRVDLYAYLHPGAVMFDDVQLKAVGEQTRHATDAAIKPPADK